MEPNEIEKLANLSEKIYISILLEVILNKLEAKKILKKDDTIKEAMTKVEKLYEQVQLQCSKEQGNA